MITAVFTRTDCLRKRISTFAAIALGSFVAFATAGVDARAELPESATARREKIRVLTYKAPDRIDIAVRVFEGKFGVDVELVHETDLSPATLAQAQGSAPFDFLLAHDTTLLERARLAGLTTPIASPDVLSSVRGQLLGPDGHWISTSMRARAFMVAKDRVAEPPRTYEDLAHPRWRGKVCMRSGAHPYNLALVGALIAHTGEMGAEDWLRGVKANLARKPTGGDRDQLRAVVDGVCDIALANTYYLSAPHTAQRVEEERAFAAKLAVILPTVPARDATHVNTSGIAILANSPSRRLANLFVTFLIDVETQALMSTVYGEYPVTPDDNMPALHRFGQLKPDPMSISRLTEHADQALALVQRVEFDAGPSH
jgi:iron(III) transport system substrate-binding protein